MTIIEMMRKFNSKNKCLKYLEKIRWKDGVICPYCDANKVSHKAEKYQGNRYQCQVCEKSFSVTVGTIFHKARKLPEWFLVLTLMLNAKKSKSSCEIARDIGMRQASVWEIMHKIRHAMQTGQSDLLKGIVEMDETYIGGKPKLKEKGLRKGGRGPDKTPVIGVVQRGGEVRTQVMGIGERMDFKSINSFFRKHVSAARSTLMTDESSIYSPMTANGVRHLYVSHQNEYVNGDIFTNTIEGFLGLIKRAWYGKHHHYSRENTHLYVSETQYKYNNRKNSNLFVDTVKRMLGVS